MISRLMRSGASPGRTPTHVGLLLGVALYTLSALAGSVAHADPQVAKINRIKAAFVYNIAKFVGWPLHTEGTQPEHFTICYYREDFLGRGFDSIHGKRIQEQRVEKSLINSIDGDTDCAVLLIPASQLDRYQQEAETVVTGRMLTIADLTAPDTPESAHRTAMVNLIRAGTSIGFEVNLSMVREQGLTMSSELLKLARIISSP